MHVTKKNIKFPTYFDIPSRTMEKMQIPFLLRKWSILFLNNSFFFDSSYNKLKKIENQNVIGDTCEKCVDEPTID